MLYLRTAHRDLGLRRVNVLKIFAEKNMKKWVKDRGIDMGKLQNWYPI
jgi:hypothetical protein